MRTELIVDALDMAVHQRRSARGLVHHSDQGTQGSTPRSTSGGAAARSASICRWDPSAIDNSMAESFFATLECEILDQHRFTCHTGARYEIMSFIEWYNHRRRHTSLDNISPVRYEESHHNTAHVA